MSPGIREVVGDEGLEVLGRGLEPIDGTVRVPNRAGVSLYGRVVKRAFVHVDTTTGPPCKSADGMVRVSGIEPVQNQLSGVGAIVSVAVGGLAGIIPGWQAARTKVVDALRHAG